MSEDDWNALLARQARQAGIDDLSTPPDKEQWRALLEQVNRAYEEHDAERAAPEHSPQVLQETYDDLQAEHDRLEAVLGALSAAVVYVDTDWRIQFANIAAEQQIDTPPESLESLEGLEGRQLFELLEFYRDEGTHTVDRDTIEGVLSKGHPYWSEDATVARADGSTYPAFYTFNPLHRDGRLEGVVVRILDISDRKEAEAEVAVARGEAEQAQQAKEAQANFLANMSHELRTPLNAILGYSQLVREEADELGYDRITPDLEKIQMAGNQLVGLIDDVLDMSKIQAGKTDIEIRDFSVDAVLDEVAASTQPRVEENGNEFVVDFEEEIGQLRTDESKLRQVLTNLVSNAGKFTEEGTVALKANVDQPEPSETNGQTYEWVVFEVSDNGIGMDEATVEQVFDPFTQADESTTRKYGGTGLGLAITKNFCQMMGARLEVDSEPGEGTTFWVKVPRSEALSEEQRATGEPATDPSGPIQSTKAREILLIDDDPHVHEMVRRLLEERDVSVYSAIDGEEGVQLARQTEPDLIVVDILMPGLNGWDVLGMLKAESETANIPVIVTSIVREKSTAFSLGADDYLVKPIDSEHLNGLLDRYGNSDTQHALVVEDDSDLRQMMHRKIESDNWSVATAEHGVAARDYLSEANPRPDVIFLDLMMPEMDGFDFLDVLQQRAEWRSIPVVVVTAMDLSEGEQKLLSTRVERILQKGGQSTNSLLTDLSELLAKIDADIPS